VSRDYFGADGMVRLLLQFKADRSAVFEGRTPFQTIFENCFEGYRGGGGSYINITTKRLSVARALLKDGENPNCKLVFHRLRGNQTTWCKPLHVSNQAMIELLLEHGADINALDASGYTPLDIFCGAVGNIFEIENSISPQKGFDIVMLLLSHGAHLSGTFSPSSYLGIIKRHGLTVPEIMTNMPTLERPKMKYHLSPIRTRVRNLARRRG
jgi:ankyrin repeat protein